MEALDYLKKIENAGYEAYIVGGYVRDYLLGCSTTDVDITTNAKPKEICQIFDINSGEELGCVNIKSSDLNVDITTYRKESNYLNHRPKKIAYVEDLITDLKRRDFTVNAICMTSSGEIYDPLGGLVDIEKKLIRVVGTVQKKFSEDPVRMLRALRLSIIYGLSLGEDELVFILNNRDLFDEISYRRKKDELGKILISKNCIDGLKLLKSLNLLEKLEIDFDEEEITYVEDYIGMWAQIRFSKNYPFSNIELARLNSIRKILENKKIDAETLLRFGIYDTKVAAGILGINKDEVQSIWDTMPIHSWRELKLTGEDIQSILNIGPSKKIKYIKIDLIREILSGNLCNEENTLKEYILEKWK